jgi:hypothetical protein
MSLFGSAKFHQRVIGMLVAVAIATVAMPAFDEVVANPTVDSLLHIRGLFDREGFGRNDAVGVALWIVAPTSAAIPAWLLTSRAGDAWAGATLGVLTYGIAVIAGPVIVVVGQLLEFGSLDVPAIVSAIVFATAAAAVILFPLLVVCLLCGQVWASITARVADDPRSRARSLPSRTGR